jgi:hypothetical protein
VGSGWIAVLRLFRNIGWDKMGTSSGGNYWKRFPMRNGRQWKMSKKEFPISLKMGIPKNGFTPLLVIALLVSLKL